MVNNLLSEDILFIVQDVFGRKIRTTKRYWQKIKEEKHTELTAEHTDVIDTIVEPEEIYRSVQDPHIAIYYKMIQGAHLVVLVKFVGEVGFVITCYQTTKTKRKGKKLWP